MTFLCLDWGLKKVGVATADPDGRVVTPRAPYLRNSSPQLWSLTAQDKEFLVRLKQDFEVAEIVLGDPLDPQKSAEPVRRAYQNFCDKLFTLLQIPVHRENEYLTSWEARKTAPEGVSEDSRAAAILLESFLSRRSRT
jgi:RNase H-fold protein (predicted Holliday junction resolvase)